MKNIYKYVIFVFSIGFLLYLYECNNKVKQNWADIHKIKIGMTFFEVDSIMISKPIGIEEAYWDDNLFVSKYESSYAASDYLKIIFKKQDSLVVEINYGD